MALTVRRIDPNNALVSRIKYWDNQTDRLSQVGLSLAPDSTGATMKILKRFNYKRWTHLGISKKKKLHVGYWCDQKQSIIWKPIDVIKEKDPAIALMV